MTTLTLKIGPLTASTTANDANAQRVLESCFALFHRRDYEDADEPVEGEEPTPPVLKTYTPQQKLNWVVRVLIPQMLVDKARQYEEAEAVRAAQAALVAATFE